MNGANGMLTLISCAFFMGLVAWISYVKTRRGGYPRRLFSGGSRRLTAVFIASSMLLTNLSAEQLIGLNGSAYDLTSAAWAGKSPLRWLTVCMAFIFLPRYLAGAFTTLPEFLNDRFDGSVRALSAVLFMVGYGLITIPSVLYAGSIAVLQLFDVPALLNVSMPKPWW